MHFSELYYSPLAFPFLLILFGAVIAALVMIEIGVLRYAYVRIGVSQRYVFAVLFLSLIGSYINIPVARLPGGQVLAGQEIVFYGVRYVIPVVRHWPGTVVAVNIGGAVIPTVLSIYLLVRNRLYASGLLGIAVVAAVVHMLAHPVPGLGIAVPIFVPPLVTTLVALILSRRYAAPLAYISGSMGTLLGADLMNLGSIRALGAPVASIGGAGTFDGIFVTGILAVILASVATAAGSVPPRHSG
ncbi:MAG: DUF1614 domain-containing protein [Gammaproteobacteria bacterium]